MTATPDKSGGKGRAHPASQDRAFAAAPSSPCGSGPSGLQSHCAAKLADIRVGDEVEYFIEGGWCTRNGQSVSRERAKVRVVSVYPDLKHGEYALGVRHDDEEYPGEGLLRLSEVTRVIPAKAVSA